MTYEEVVQRTTEYILSLPDKSKLTMGEALYASCPGEEIDFINPLRFDHLDDVVAAVEKTGVVLDFSAHDGLVEGLPFNLDFIVWKKRLQKVRIVSNLMCFGLCPNPEDPIEQRLTISASGCIWFTEYLYGKDGEHTIGRKKQFSIGKERTAAMLSLIADYIEQDPDIMLCTDIGSWELHVTYPDSSGATQISGSLCGGVCVGTTDLTEYIQDVIPIEGLKIFGQTLDDEDEELPFH